MARDGDELPGERIVVCGKDRAEARRACLRSEHGPPELKVGGVDGLPALMVVCHSPGKRALDQADAGWRSDDRFEVALGPAQTGLQRDGGGQTGRHEIAVQRKRRLYQGEVLHVEHDSGAVAACSGGSRRARDPLGVVACELLADRKPIAVGSTETWIN